MSEQTWFTVPEAADYARRNKGTVWRAVQSGELVGYQRDAGGHWTIHRDDLDRWIRGETPVQAPAVCRPRRRKAS